MKKMRRSLSTILQLTIDNFDAISPRYCNQTYIESNDPTMMKKLLDSGHKIDDYLSMNILKDMRNDPRCKDEFEGPGIIRIIDKLTCMNLTVLIYSSARCARNSSFTARIIDERINAHNNEFLVLTVMTKLIVVAIIDDLQQEYTRSSKLCVWFPRTWCLKNFIKPNQIISISLISPKNVNNNNSINKKCYHYASVKFYSKRSELFKSNNLFPNQLKFHLPTTTITSTSTIDNLSQLMNNLNISSSSSASLDVNSKIMEKEGETEIVISRSLACNLGVCSVQDKIDNIKFPISFIFEKKIDNIPIATEVILSKLSSPPSTLPLGTRFKQINYYFNQEIFKRANLGSIVSRDSIIYQNGCNGIQLYKVSRVNSSFILTDPADSVARIAESTKLEINVNNNNNVDVDDFRLLLNGFPDKSKWVKDIVNEIGSLDDVVTSIIDQLYTFVITAISANNQGSKKKVFKRSKGILLIGKPGTGKTSLALRIAETSRLPYLIINCPEIFKSDEGIVENRLCTMFESMMTINPVSIIIMDEIDIISDNSAIVNSGVEMKLFSALIKIIDSINEDNYCDGLEKKGQIFVIGTTNRFHAVSNKIYRSGRLDRIYELNIKTSHQRYKILEIITKKIPFEKGKKNLILEKISKTTHGFVATDLQYLCKQILSGAKFSVDLNDFYESLNIVKPSNLNEFQTKLSIIEPFNDPNNEFFDFGISAPNGVLIYGPPGVGKTMLCCAIASEIEINFILIESSQIISKLVGESEKNISKIFSYAKSNSPCILFIDQFDILAQSRGINFTTENTSERIVTSFLTEMDGFFTNKAEDKYKVLVIAATNRPEVLDLAILRPGRLDQHIYIPPPNNKVLFNYNCADLDNLCREAALICLRKNINNDVVTFDCFEEALKFSDPSLLNYQPMRPFA
ncbi:13051_t:CDS:10 [Entrophospora sp. SA101]|nr:24649_t:CDS:10 [Entrophospora sp. SA101]CAJ0762470.1 13051_t:CDS:10 [Entrophospora sp. SA101]